MEDAFAACRGVLRRSGSSFALAFHILPRAERRAMTAFYALCRAVDDAVDESSDPGMARAVLEAWRERLRAVYEPGEPAEHPVVVALRWAVGRFGLRRSHLELVLAGVAQDLERPSYETFGELYEYCYRVASSVGLVCVTVLGDPSPEAARYAELAGIAVQLVNILRDVGEDAALGRIYLPREDLRAFGVAEADVLARRPSAALRALLRFEAARAAHYDRLASAALPPARRRRLYFAEALRETYRRLREQLVAAELALGGERISVGAADRLRIALKHRLYGAVPLAGGV